MIKDLIDSRIKAFNIKNILQILLASVLMMIIFMSSKFITIFIGLNFSDKYYRVFALAFIFIGNMIQFNYYVIARLIAMLNIDYDKLITPLDVIRSRRIKQIIKISLILYVVYAIKIGFIKLLKPEWMNDMFLRTLANYVLTQILLVKFRFTVPIMLEYNKSDFITALGKSWDIISGKKLIGMILLALSTIHLTFFEAILQKMLDKAIKTSILMGMGVMTLIFFIIAYKFYLQVVYYYNYSKEDTNEFGPYR